MGLGRPAQPAGEPESGKPGRKPAVNREGMTFAEWYAAARLFRKTPVPNARKNWKNGVDPTEFAREDNE